MSFGDFYGFYSQLADVFVDAFGEALKSFGRKQTRVNMPKFDATTVTLTESLVLPW